MALPAIATLVGSTMGAGVVALPATFQQLSLPVAIPFLAATGIFTVASTHILLRCIEMLRRRGVQVENYGDLTLTLGPAAQITMEAIIVLVLGGVIISIEILIVDSLAGIVELWPARPMWLTGPFLGGLVLMVVSLPLSLVRQITWLKNSSAAATVAIGYLVLLLIVLGCSALVESNRSPWSAFMDPTWGRSFANTGVIVYCFGSQVQAVPVFASWKDTPSSFVNRVTVSVVVICGLIYVLAGTFGVLGCWRDVAISPDILTELGEHSVPAIVARVGVVLSMACVVPLMVFSGREAAVSLLRICKTASDRSRQRQLGSIVPSSTSVNDGLARPPAAPQEQLVSTGLPPRDRAVSTIDRSESFAARSMSVTSTGGLPARTTSTHRQLSVNSDRPGQPPIAPLSSLAGGGSQRSLASGGRREDRPSAFSRPAAISSSHATPGASEVPGRLTQPVAQAEWRPDHFFGFATSPHLHRMRLHTLEPDEEEEAGQGASAPLLAPRPVAARAEVPTAPPTVLPSWARFAVAVAIIATTFILAVLISSVQVVFAVVGATGGCVLFYIFPGALFLRLASEFTDNPPVAPKAVDGGRGDCTGPSRFEVVVAWIMVCLGTFVGVVATTMTILTSQG